MEKNKVTDNVKKIFRLALGVTIFALMAIVTFIVFAFLRMDELELYTCLIAGLGMAILLALVTITLWLGIKAFRE